MHAFFCIYRQCSSFDYIYNLLSGVSFELLTVYSNGQMHTIRAHTIQGKDTDTLHVNSVHPQITQWGYRV